jgi:calcineurin-like phosphoesterase family protein
MERNIWIISDTHFQHANMLNFVDMTTGEKFRHFDNQKECDELMIQNWNKNVKPQDHIWHLGDVFMGDNDTFCENIWPRLQGHKRLVVGNHDDIRFLSNKNPFTGEWFFSKIAMWKNMEDMILTHVPMQLDNTYEGKYRATFNVHGHIHQNASPTLRHFNACVEKNKYSPINYEDLRDLLRKRKEAL